MEIKNSSNPKDVVTVEESDPNPCCITNCARSHRLQKSRGG